MAAAPLLRGFHLLRFRLPRRRLLPLAVGSLAHPRRPWCSAAEVTRQDEDLSSASKATPELGVKHTSKYQRMDDPDYRKWKDKEEEIFQDIEPILMLTREILHSYRYADGEQLGTEDEKAVVDKLLAYHPQSEDKIGGGLDSIMVDRHPEFRGSRCLFVVRTDGGWIDFSYQKCLRAYIRNKYPAHAERFIQEHFKRGSR